MPGDRPDEALKKLFSLALACIRTDNLNYRPKVGSHERGYRDESTVLDCIEAVLQYWP